MKRSEKYFILVAFLVRHHLLFIIITSFSSHHGLRILVFASFCIELETHTSKKKGAETNSNNKQTKKKNQIKFSCIIIYEIKKEDSIFISI